MNTFLNFKYIFLLVLIFISCFHVHNFELALISCDVETLNSGANLPSLIKFDIALATSKNLLKIAVLKERLEETEMKKIG